jgi:hypothetical protein
VKGHLSQRRKKLWSTTTTVSKRAPDAEALDDVTPEAAHVKTRQVFAAMVDVGKVYGDLTGLFPIQSSSGHKYVLTLYDYDSNTISTEPTKNRTDRKMIRAYTSLHEQLINAGLKPELQVMDNECSKAFRQYLTDEHIYLQLVPPHLTRQNVAERAIQTFKNHFVAGLCSVDKQFTMHLWCELLPQATLTLNMLRTSRINPTISAATQLFGQFDFNRTPLAVAHVKPKARRTWAPHGEDAWYVGPAPDHYRCYRVWMVATNRTRVVDTVEFPPQHVEIPHLSSQEMVIQAARQLTFALRNPAPAAPFSRLGHQQHEALAKLANIFKEIAAPELSDAITTTTAKSVQQPIPSIAHTEVPISIPSFLQQLRFTPQRVDGAAPRVEAPSPRVNRTAVKVMTPLTNAHRMLDSDIKTPTASPHFDIYKQRRQTTPSPQCKIHSAVPERVVTYLGDTTRQLLQDLRAETGWFYNTRSTTRKQTDNAITRFIPAHNQRIESEYGRHMANKVTHAITGETLYLRKLVLNPET